MASAKSLIESLRGSGRRVTRQRQLVMRVLQDNPGHLEVEAVYALAKASDPNISLPTVYRTLAVLKEMGLVEDHTLSETPERQSSQTSSGLAAEFVADFPVNAGTVIHAVQ